VAFETYGDVILTRDVPESGLRAGDVATVVERHTVAGVSEDGYSVEFFDMTGNTVGVDQLKAHRRRPHERHVWGRHSDSPEAPPEADRDGAMSAAGIIP
jgi:hypothetical protein